jgi:hypothetical protein
MGNILPTNHEKKNLISGDVLSFFPHLPSSCAYNISNKPAINPSIIFMFIIPCI